MIAMLLAAGRGERMQPLSRSLAKPAVPLLGDPMVVHGLRALVAAGAERAVVNVHHRPNDVIAAIGDCTRIGLERVFVSDESAALLGTGGGLRRAARWLSGSGTIAVRNGDFVADIDAASALAAHRASGCPATMVVTAPRAGYTPVPVSDDGRVLGFGDDVVSDRIAGRYTFTGLHFMEDDLLDRLPDGPSNLIPALYAGLAAEGRLGAFVHHGFWWEFGDPAAYRDGVRQLLRLTPSERDGVLRHDPVSVDGGVSLARGAGARWADAVRWSGEVAVGARSEIGRGARLSDTVLLPDVRVGARAVLTGCVVAPGVEIPVGARFDDALVCADPTPGVPLPPGTTRIDDLLVRALPSSAS